MPTLQLKTKPYSSSTGIYDNSVFQTGRITLNGDSNGVGIIIGTSQPLSLDGDFTQGITYNTGALIEDHLYVDAGISTNGDVQIGMTGSEEQIVTLGLPFDDKAWRMRKLDETIRWEKYDTTSQQWELMIRFSEC